MLDLRELDSVTREYMMREFQAELAATPHFIPKVLSVAGEAAWPTTIEAAIRNGDDDSLLNGLLSHPEFFNSTEQYVRDGVERTRKVNHRQAAERLANSEFLTWYVRGLSARLVDEGVEQAIVYRAAEPKWAVASCTEHEGAIVDVAAIYNGHRSRYWPVPNEAAFSIPFQAGCHHSIERLS